MHRGHLPLTAAIVVATTLATALTAAPRVTASKARSRTLERATPRGLGSQFLSVRPRLGKVWVVDLAGEPPARRRMARTLQGVVNRTRARLYVVESGTVDPGSAEDFWIEHYRRRGLVEVAGRTDIDAALDVFAAEASGYVLASDAERWTVAAEYRDALAYAGLAALRPTDRAFDFVVQQQILTVDVRPSQTHWNDVVELVDSYPVDHAVYGYFSDTGVEELASRTAAGCR